MTDEVELKHQAAQMLLLLPEDPAEAMRVVEYFNELVEWQLKPKTKPVLQLVR
jgi:hypothetical protein